MSERAVVIGAGVGGLSAAAALAAEGVEVTVLERQPTPGGKMREVVAGDARLDAGPTVFTMRWIFDELFERAGARLDDYLTLSPVDRLARHGWTDGASFDLYADEARSVEAVSDFAGAEEGRRFHAFRRRAREIYEVLEQPYIADQKPDALSLVSRVGLGRIGALWNTRPFRSMAAQLARDLHDPKLRQLFGRYATYCGSSPYAAPATLMLVAHVELAGVWLVGGGMHQVARAVERLGAEKGVAFRYGAHVEEIEVEHGRVSGVRLADGESLPADAVICNGDVGAIAGGLFGEGARRAVPPVPRDQRSISAVVWSLKAAPQGFPLIRHSVFFDAGDYSREFDAIFHDRRTPDAPTAYVCAQDRGEDPLDGSGPERLHIHVNAPADGDIGGPDEKEIARCATRSFELMRRCGLELETEAQVLTTPREFESLFPGTGGALFGRVTHGPLGAFGRPAARTRLPGLYVAGGSTHPGAGVPMAAMSGRLAAMAVCSDRASTRRFRPAATSGGISTRSPTTESAR